ncbi:hypothetical protein SUGI_0674280 [Cryptomeria japonica]|nr:hypothetical protein SUGI_0674280 [Cryptomeria japonica]
MAKGVYVSVLLLLVMASSVFASNVPMLYDYRRYCGFWSGHYHGACIFPGDTGRCDTTCTDDDHADFGDCKWTSKLTACICFSPC